MQPECLLDRRLEHGDLAQRLVAHVGPAGVELVELLHHRVHRAGIAQQFDERPRRGARCGVVPGEHHRDEHAGDLVGGERGVAVFVAHRQQHVDEVHVVLVGCRLREPLGLDALDPLHQRGPGRVTTAEALDVEVGIDERQRVGALFEVVEQVRIGHVEFLAELVSDQARRGGVDEQLGEPVEQVDLSLVVPLLDHPGHLGRDRLRVAAHELVAQRLVVEHPAAFLGSGVEDHSLTEHGGHEGIRRCLVELLVRGAEEHLVGLGTGEQHDVLVGKSELADVAALRAHPAHEADRIRAQLLEVAGSAVVP